MTCDHFGSSRPWVMLRRVARSSRALARRLRRLSGGRRHKSGSSATGNQDESSQGIKTNLDLKWMVANIAELETNARAREVDVDVAKLGELYTRGADLGRKVQDLRSERKSVAKAMSNRDIDAERRQELIARGKAIKVDIADAESELAQANNELNALALRIPNLTSPETPTDAPRVTGFIGCESEREETGPDEASVPPDHTSLGESLGILDFAATARVAGASQGCFMRRDGALLELALVNFAMYFASERGYEPVITPDLARREIVERCGFAPRGHDGLDSQVYSVQNSDLCLIGTSEIPLAGQFASQTLEPKQLPAKFVGFSHCFRREAGGAGVESKGLYRLHQFSKVELFAFTEPGASDAAFDEIVELQKEFFGLLDLECRVLEMPANDMGASAYRKVDIEAWLPGRGRYGEISSASNCSDYQSKRLDIRYKLDRTVADTTHAASADATREAQRGVSASGKTAFVHTLNGTACAIPRTILAIMEQHQRPDGSVAIPEALQPYLAGKSVIRPQTE